MNISKINDILDSIKIIDEETYEHLERVAVFAFALAKEIKLEPKQLETTYFTGLLHDIGVLSSVKRDTKECNEFGSMILRFVDNSEIIANAIKHQQDFHLQEEENLSLLISEIVAIASKYDELANVEGLKHEQALETLKKNNFKNSLLTSFENVLIKEELI